MARPQSDEPRNQPVCVRFTAAEKDLLTKQAKGRTLAEFIRVKLLGRPE